jgi:hypothetical protein
MEADASALASIPIISNSLSTVMAGLVPVIHVLLRSGAAGKTWAPATSAGMTREVNARN